MCLLAALVAGPSTAKGIGFIRSLVDDEMVGCECNGGIEMGDLHCLVRARTVGIKEQIEIVGVIEEDTDVIDSRKVGLYWQ